MAFESDFRVSLISLINTVLPSVPVVRRNQNVSQVADIASGDPMMDIDVERIIKVGTDYTLPITEDGTLYWCGDRLVQVSLELFSPNALDKMTNFRDILETYSYREKMNALGIMEQRVHSEPRSTTRLHGETQYVESAIYSTRFHATILYIDAVGIPSESTIVKVGMIEHGEITGMGTITTF